MTDFRVFIAAFWFKFQNKIKVCRESTNNIIITKNLYGIVKVY